MFGLRSNAKEKYMTIFYFTSTGNSLAVAKRIGGNLISIPQIIDNREMHYNDDAIGVVFPVYSNAPPRMARQFLDMVNGQCVKCGVCAKVCPAKNIAVTDKVRFSDHYEACLACVHLCPQNAIHLKNERSGKRWRNPEVSLAEIINANNRWNN
jgi:ferredoxin